MKDSFPKHHHAFIYSLMRRGAGIALCVWHLPTSHQRHLRLLHSFPLAQEHVTHWTDPGLVSVEVPVISLEGQGWKAGWLQQQTLLPPCPAGWRLRPRGGQGWLPLRPLFWRADGRLPPVSSHRRPSGCVCVPISSYKDPGLMGSEPPWGPQFSLITCRKTQLCETSDAPSTASVPQSPHNAVVLHLTR